MTEDKELEWFNAVMDSHSRMKLPLDLAKELKNLSDEFENENDRDKLRYFIQETLEAHKEPKKHWEQKGNWNILHEGEANKK